jgi:hypothetical protein
MKFGFDKPYFPIQKVDKPEMDEQIIIKPGRSFGMAHLEHVYHMIVAYAFNAGIRYANSLLKKILPDEVFNQQFGNKYIEFNKDGVYRLCENMEIPEDLSPHFKKGEDYLFYQLNSNEYTPFKNSDKSEIKITFTYDAIQKYFYRPFKEIQKPERSVSERQDRRYCIVHKDVTVWGNYVGDIKFNKWPLMDDVKEKKVPKKNVVPMQESPGVFVPKEVKGIIIPEQVIPKGKLVVLKKQHRGLKKGTVLAFDEKCVDRRTSTEERYYFDIFYFRS